MAILYVANAWIWAWAAVCMQNTMFGNIAIWATQKWLNFERGLFLHQYLDLHLFVKLLIWSDIDVYELLFQVDYLPSKFR